MRKPSVAALAAVAASAIAAVSVTTGQPAIEQELSVRVPMRDGVHLSTNVFRPAGATRRATLLARTPYGKGTALSPTYRGFVDRGYAVVVQDVRGMHDSEGVFNVFEQEGPDGDDTISWIARQPWSDGNVGMVGGSYLGIAQWQAALRGNPHLKAIFPVVSGYDDYFDRYYSRGGGFKLGHRLEWMAENVRTPGFAKPDLKAFIWTLPTRIADRAATGHTVDWYQRVLDHPSYDSFWRTISTREKLSRVRVPVFSVGGWYDNYGQSDIEAFDILRGLGRTAHIVIGPWGHNMSEKIAGIDFGKDAASPVRKFQLEWFDHWLRGVPLPELPAAHLFFTGENEWRDEDEWPPRDARALSWFIGSKGHANTASGDGTLGPGLERHSRSDRFTYNPRNPVPTRGGALCCNVAVLPPGPLDQRAVETRPDVLVYTTGALKTAFEIAGPVQAQFYVSTSAPDTDFTAKLVDVYPDGTARLVSDGMLRLRYRDGLDKPQFARPGQTYKILIDAGVAAHVFQPGHRVRLEISSSNFPRFDRNLNSGGPVAAEKVLRTAEQTVYHGGNTPSALIVRALPKPRERRRNGQY